MPSIRQLSLHKIMSYFFGAYFVILSITMTIIYQQRRYCPSNDSAIINALLNQTSTHMGLRKILNVDDMESKSKASTFVRQASPPESVFRNNKDDSQSRETAIIIPTHLVPSHPSLHLLMEVMNSIDKYISGLHPKAPIIITVDNLMDNSKRNRAKNGLFLLDNEENRKKQELYVEALHKKFADNHRITTLVSEKGVGLAKNLGKAIDILHQDTKYMYIVQHDLPFIKMVNHTAIVKTTKEYPDLIRIIRFNLYGAVHSNYGCSIPDIHANGITLKKYSKWSDQNHFASVEHYKRDVIPATKNANKVFPEARLQVMASKNCTYYGPFYYYDEKKYGGPWYKHLDATERYGARLAARIERGDVNANLLSAGNLKDLEMNQINTTELLEMGAKQKR